MLPLGIPWHQKNVLAPRLVNKNAIFNRVLVQCKLLQIINYVCIVHFGNLYILPSCLSLLLENRYGYYSSHQCVEHVLDTIQFFNVTSKLLFMNSTGPKRLALFSIFPEISNNQIFLRVHFISLLNVTVIRKGIYLGMA